MNNSVFWGLKAYTVAFLLYTFTPLILVSIFAWNKGEGYFFPLQGFTWKWFFEFFGDSTAKKSIANSLIISFSSASISTILAMLLSIGIIKGSFKRSELYITLLMLPVLMPSLTIAISALVFFKTIGFPSGILIVILAHVSISMSYVFLIIMSRIESFPLNLQEAALDLGASWLSSIKDIIFPNLLPVVIVGWLFSFILSWNEFIVTYFLIGNSTTIPIYIFSQLRFGISPKINVVSVLVTLFALVFIFIILSVTKIYQKILTNRKIV
jgi:spermidine/putrescine transport system permease protein